MIELSIVQYNLIAITVLIRVVTFPSENQRKCDVCSALCGAVFQLNA
jgi:hypothetical protein